MAERRAFLLRIDPAILDGVQRWANDELRSLNGQIEFLLRRSLEETARSPRRGGTAAHADPGAGPDGRVADE